MARVPCSARLRDETGDVVRAPLRRDSDSSSKPENRFSRRSSSSVRLSSVGDDVVHFLTARHDGFLGAPIASFEQLDHGGERPAVTVELHHNVAEFAQHLAS